MSIKISSYVQITEIILSLFYSYVVILKSPTSLGQFMELPVLGMDAERKINSEFTLNSLIMSTLYGQLLIVMEFAKIVLYPKRKALVSMMYLYLTLFCLLFK